MITSTNEKKKKKDLMLKISTVNDDSDDDEDKEVALLSRKFKRFLFIEKKVQSKLIKMTLMML